MPPRGQLSIGGLAADTRRAGIRSLPLSSLPAKTIVDSQLHRVNVLIHIFNAVPEIRAEGSWIGTKEIHIPAAEIIELIFELGRPVVGEGPFETAADSPATASL